MQWVLTGPIEDVVYPSCANNSKIIKLTRLT